MTKLITKPKVIVIAGPTSSGKTGLSLRLAKKYNSEIISADSRQVYKGMDIGSGKVELDKNLCSEGIQHYLIDVASPKSTYTVSKFTRDAKKAIKKIRSKNRIPMVVGGTAFYIEALIYDLKLPDVKPNLILRKKLEKKSLKALVGILKKLDPKRIKNIDLKNKRRLIRAIEIAKSLGKVPKISKKSPYDVLWLGIKRTDDKLRNLINIRLEKRFKDIVKEIKKLRKSGVSFKKLSSFGLEYKYFSLYLMNKLNKKELEQQIKTAIWQFAKRQYTYLKRLPVLWIKNEKQAEKEIKKFIQ